MSAEPVGGEPVDAAPVRPASAVSRRRFLQSAAVVAGGAAVGPGQASPAGAAARLGSCPEVNARSPAWRTGT